MEKPIFQATLCESDLITLGVITISFPLTPEEYDHSISLLTEQHMGDPVHQDCFVDTITSAWPALKCLEGQYVNVDELDYPHEFSGGQRQRIGIARTLALDPEFIVCDEPISALDVSIQAQVINLLENIQKKLGISYLFIAHDLSMVKHISDRIGVMYLGHIVETGPSKVLYRHPLHPYTQGLLSAVPIPDPKTARQHRRIMLDGEIPTPINPKPCCPFASRCPRAMDQCFQALPPMVEVEGRQVACFLYQESGCTASEIQSQ